jgi:hypothetical protein
MVKLVEEGKDTLQPRILSFQEVNLDFYFFNDNVFHFGKPKLLPLFKMLADEQQN